MTKEPPPHILGQDGALQNVMKDIEQTVRLSLGFVLELGSGKGTGSTVAIQRGLIDHPNPLHISVDLTDRMEWKPDAPWWHLILGDTREQATLEQVEAISGVRSASVIFIDTVHTYDQVQRELDLWSALVGSDTIWLFHDTNMHGQGDAQGLVRAIQEHTGRTGWVYDDFRTEPHGLGRMRL